MADVTDPLSGATRATKRNLLVASVLGIAANAFRVSVDKIPIAGLSINFDDRLFSFLLLCVLIYFLGTFILYYSIDINNFEKTSHQTESEKRYRLRINDFDSHYLTLMQNDLQARAPKEFLVKLSAKSWNPGAV